MKKEILKNIPKSPWIYKFIDKNKKIIYIWKSVNLKSRVNSYFNGIKKLNFAKQKMVKQITDIETIITNNETESLILETTLIKNHSPKYNILMKDWKNHIYIKITSDDYPKIIKTRFKNKKSKIKNINWNKEYYFWPYTSTYYVTNLLKLIKTIFWYWIWEHNFFLNKNNYNLDKYIFKNNLELKDYTIIINNIKEFLKWNISKIKQQLEIDMKQYAKNLKFEKANKIKLDIESIKILEENQIVREWINWDYNIITIVEKYEKSFIWMIEIKNSKIVWFFNFDIKNNLWENKEKLIKNIVEKVWSEEDNKKIIYILPIEIDFWNIDIKTEIPKIGTKKELLDLCYKNIYEYASKSHINSLSTKWFTKKTMHNLLSILWYKVINKQIIFECNDISHISWNYTVASRSIIENWKSNISKYKKFKIKTLDEQKIDDFNSMREIITRRIKELKKLNNYPDLIVIDWWKWQLSSVVEIIDKYNLNLQVVWIAKKEEELFLPWNSEPIILEKDSNELRLVQKIRDEAHRFAITFNRDSRIKWMKKNILEDLPWFWPKTRKKILNKYWNIEKFLNQEESILKNIVSKSQIEILKSHWLIK